MNVPLIVLHFIRSWHAVGFIAALKLAACNILRADVLVGVGPKKSQRLFVRGNAADYHAFYTVFVRNDYPCVSDYQPDLILDLGANVGYSAVFFKLRYPSCEVICVEPDSENIEVLARNVNGLEGITCLLKAVMGRGGELVELEGENKISGRVKTGSGDIETVSISELIKGVQKDTKLLVKMDIEGAEKDVFEGDVQWLKFVDFLYLEVHKGAWPAVVRSLAKVNFDCSICGENLRIDMR